jgi:hypothetical protein
LSPRKIAYKRVTTQKIRLPSAAYGFVLDDDPNAFFTTAENLAQPQDNESFSQRADFACGLGVGRGTFAGVNIIGGPTG